MTRRKTVLIIEDDNDILENLVEFVESEGFDTLQARNGREALELLARSETLPDSIILDLMMPIMDGAEFRRQQEQDPRIAHIPVILLSADRQIEIKRLRMGAVEFLPKPVDIDQLSLILKNY